MWLDLIKPYTKRTIINNKNKTITLVHPHFQSGTIHLRKLLKSIKHNQFTSYQVECVGFMSIKGALIIKMIERTLKKYDNIEFVKSNINIESGIYELTIKFR